MFMMMECCAIKDEEVSLSDTEYLDMLAPLEGQSVKVKIEDDNNNNRDPLLLDGNDDPDQKVALIKVCICSGISR